MEEKIKELINISKEIVNVQKDMWMEVREIKKRLKKLESPEKQSRKKLGGELNPQDASQGVVSPYEPDKTLDASNLEEIEGEK